MVVSVVSAVVAIGFVSGSVVDGVAGGVYRFESVTHSAAGSEKNPLRLWCCR